MYELEKLKALIPDINFSTLEQEYRSGNLSAWCQEWRRKVFELLIAIELESRKK